MSNTNITFRTELDESEVYIGTELDYESGDVDIYVEDSSYGPHTVLYLNCRTGRFGYYELDDIDAQELTEMGIKTERLGQDRNVVQFEEEYETEDDPDPVLMPWEIAS